MSAIGIYMKDGSRYEIEADSWQSLLSDGHPSIAIKNKDGGIEKRVFPSSDVVIVGTASGVTYFPAPTDSPTS